jgi:hypothetical protein
MGMVSCASTWSEVNANTCENVLQYASHKFAARSWEDKDIVTGQPRHMSLVEVSWPQEQIKSARFFDV